MSTYDYGFDSSDFALFSFFCLFFWTYYLTIEGYFHSLKSKSWLLTLFSSFILSTFGTLYVIRAQLFDLWNEDHIFGEDYISRVVMLFFLATNVMDFLLAYLFYRKYMDPVSTIGHHIFYSIFIITLLLNRYSRGFILCFFMEIPTFFLALGSVWNHLRSDISFGVSFVCTRITYNIWLAYQLAVMSPAGVIWKVCLAVLGLHCFWFYKWCVVYGKSLLGSYLSSSALDKQ